MPALKNDRHERFCQEYLADMNLTQAYIRAGYGRSCTESTRRAASRLGARADVRLRMAELMAQRSRRTGVTADRVVRELARIAFLDPARLVDMQSGAVCQDVGEDDRAAIAGVKVKTGEGFAEREIKFADKLKALEMLGRHMNMFKDDIRLNVTVPKILDDIGADG